VKLSFGASGFVISRPAIPLAASVSMSGVDIYLFLMLHFFAAAYDVCVCGCEYGGQCEI
jgi:Na+/H+-dicarboxylate symporter